MIALPDCLIRLITVVCWLFGLASLDTGEGVGGKFTGPKILSLVLPPTSIK